MNRIILSLLFNILILWIINFQLTSSVSFPNPPQKPPPNASPDEQALFWRLLHNYYAIIARPRFGKRFSSTTDYYKDPSFVPIVDHDPISVLSSAYAMNPILSKSIPNSNDQRINEDSFYTFEFPEQRRRRRR